MIELFYQILMTKESRNLLWIIGGGGLLGSSLIRTSVHHSKTFCLWQGSQSKFNWESSSSLKNQLGEQLKLFLNSLSPTDNWTLIWAAGTGIIGSNEIQLRKETENFVFFLELLSESLTYPGQTGTIFLASSAGGVWGGAKELPINETTPICPISDYGKNKLAQERLLTQFGNPHPNIQIIIGRISNLFGPGQKLEKPQGLISQMCRSVFTKIPLEIFVPPETVRDYLYIDDCSELIFRLLNRAHAKAQKSGPSLEPWIKIFASEEPVSIQELLSLLRHLTQRDPLVTYPQRLISSQQPKELSFRSQVEVESYRCRPLIEGLSEILNFQESQLQLGVLPFPTVA
jgi:UDP-glucose 4-epimerase